MYRGPRPSTGSHWGLASDFMGSRDGGARTGIFFIGRVVLPKWERRLGQI